MTAEKIIFEQMYDAESLYDIQRDILECLNPEFNENIKDIPVDAYFMPEGEFIVTITWKN